MSAQDALWLTMDRPNNLMVVDGAMMLAEVPDLGAVREVFRTAVERFPVLARRAVRQGTTWAWRDDDDFDLDEHVTAAGLAEPGDMGALQRFVAQQRAVPLHRDRPLWRGFLVHPLALDDGTAGAAVVTRFHHSMADGVRLTQVMLSLLSDEHQRPLAAAPAPDAARTPADGVRRALGSAAGAVTGRVSAALAGAVVHPLGTLAALPRRTVALPGQAAGAVVSAASGLVRAGTRGLDAGFDGLRRQDRMLDALEELGVRNNRAANDLTSVAKLALGGSDATVWSGTPGRAKAMAWSRPLPLAGIKAVGRAQGATVNDVLLAAVAGGLARYLARHGGVADEVQWMVPVNLKPFAENLPRELGNYFALVWLPMPLGLADPAARVKEMHRRMEWIKNSDEATLTFGLQRLLSLTPSQVSAFITNFFANKAVGVLTNVPGPRGPMSFAGARVTQVVGFAPCSGDNPMSATIFSYDGAVTVGFSTDAGLVPDPDVLAQLVVDELAAIEAALRPAGSTRRPRRSPRAGGTGGTGGTGGSGGA